MKVFFILLLSASPGAGHESLQLIWNETALGLSSARDVYSAARTETSAWKH